MSKHIIRTEVLSLRDCRTYVKNNSERLGRTNFWKVVNPLKVWKRTNHVRESGKVIVALSIPVNATVFMQTDTNGSNTEARKMRASEAFVEKQFHVGWPFLEDYSYSLTKYEEVQVSHSGHNWNFKYKTGEVVKPYGPFSKLEEQCASGIHFFVNLSDALAY